ncbi:MULTISPECIES: hypothetical protein [Pseudomonas]|uniref:hypothetical protein n=1 Tax=Pseudomonas TaxID=286 RepID=UPI0011AA30EA|nr:MULTISPECIES: hypothetical protein [Pseudomonas]
MSSIVFSSSELTYDLVVAAHQVRGGDVAFSLEEAAWSPASIRPAAPTLDKSNTVRYGPP